MSRLWFLKPRSHYGGMHPACCDCMCIQIYTHTKMTTGIAGCSNIQWIINYAAVGITISYIVVFSTIIYITANIIWKTDVIYNIYRLSTEARVTADVFTGLKSKLISVTYSSLQHSLSSATPYHTNQPQVNPLYVGRHSCQSICKTWNWKAFIFFCGAISMEHFQMRCASPLLIVYLDV